jgi:hypothetical protein
MVKYTIVGPKGSQLSPAADLVPRGPRPTYSDKRSVRAKKSTKTRTSVAPQPSGAELVHTLDVKPTNHPVGKLAENRALCLETAKNLDSRTSWAATLSIPKAARKIRTCSLLGAFRSLSDDVNYKIGQALCKCRLCPNCQRVLSAKRKANFLEWFDLNHKVLAGFRFYHLVLTVRHSRADQVRNHVYTGDLVRYFAQLRGTDQKMPGWRTQKYWWDSHVAGGFSSVELKPGRDGSPHIHMHVLLLAREHEALPVYRKDRPSVFLKHLRQDWLKITGDSQNCFLEPVYYTNEDGKKIYQEEGLDVNQIRKGVAECMKYTLKSDETSLAGYSDQFLDELLSLKNRYYNRFGILAKKCPGSEIFVELDRLNTDFQDLEQLKAKELQQLYNPETGEIQKPDSVRIAVTYFTNTKAKTAPTPKPIDVKPGQADRGGEHYFFFKVVPDVQFFEPDEKKDVALTLARSVMKPYKAFNDLAGNEETGLN